MRSNSRASPNTKGFPKVCGYGRGRAHSGAGSAVGAVIPGAGVLVATLEAAATALRGATPISCYCIYFHALLKESSASFEIEALSHSRNGCNFMVIDTMDPLDLVRWSPSGSPLSPSRALAMAGLLQEPPK